MEALLVPNLGTTWFSAVVLEEKGVKLDMLQDPPVLRSGGHRFPVCTDVPRMYKLGVVLSREETSHHTVVVDEVNLWHRKMGHCNERALQYRAKSPTTGVKLPKQWNRVNCYVCAISKSRKKFHPPLDRKRSSRRLELVHADVWGKHSEHVVRITETLSV